MFELVEPYPFTDVTRADMLDQAYAGLGARSTEDRQERIKWALAAGGDV